MNYGRLGNNLPPPEQVVSLLKSRNIPRVRLFEPQQDAIQALEGSAIEVVLGTLNGDLPRLASDPSFATQWVAANVVPYANSVTFRYITAGNEVVPGDFETNVLPAMQNLDSAIAAANLTIPVTTVVSIGVLGASFPPSAVRCRYSLNLFKIFDVFPFIILQVLNYHYSDSLINYY